MLVVEDGTGLSNSNSYVTLEEANERIGLIYAGSDSSWTALGINTRNGYLVRAAEIINIQNFQPYPPVSRDQAMPFPKASAIYTGTGISLGQIPVILKNAQIELAYTYIDSPVFPTENRSIQRASIGDLSIEYSDRTINSVVEEPILPNRILQLLRPLLAGSSALTLSY